jgi:hypothetical protein
MTDSTAEPKGSKDRSPAFPFIPLKTAIERLVSLETMFTRHPIPALKAGLAWGMKEASSQASQTLAALKYFGLVEYQGDGTDRVATLTDDARTYLRAQQDTVKAEVLRRVALRPKAISLKWETWGADRPPDPVCLDQLVLKDKFGSPAAVTFLKVYDETIAYAGLGREGTIPPVKEETPPVQHGAQHGLSNPPLSPPMPPPAANVDELRVVLDGMRIQVSANVDLKGARRLIKALKANMALLEDDENDDAEDDSSLV